jgi:hypothetical protein
MPKQIRNLCDLSTEHNSLPYWLYSVKWALAMDSSLLLWSVLFGGIGGGFFLYGKKQKALVPLAVGVALIVLPYFISHVVLLLLIGAVLVVLPYYLRF